MNELSIQKDKFDLDYFKSLARVALSSGNYAGMKEAEMLNLMMSAKSLGVDPLKAINGGFYIVKGKVIMSTALMSDRIRKAGHSIKIVEWSTDKCVIIGIRKDNGDSVKVEYTMDDAQRAGLAESPTWKKFPKNMLYNRAMSTLARVLYSDILGSAYSEDEGHDIKNTKPEDREEIGTEIDIQAAQTLEQMNKEVEEKFWVNVEVFPMREKIPEYLDFCCEKHKCDPFDLMKRANENLDKFREFFDKWLVEKEMASKNSA